MDEVDEEDGEDLFGELRAVLHDLGGDEGSEPARVREFLAIVELASEREPDAFAEQWLPYLQSQRLPQVRLLDYEEFLRLQRLVPQLAPAEPEEPSSEGRWALQQRLELVCVEYGEEFVELFGELVAMLPRMSRRVGWEQSGELLASLELAADLEPVGYQRVFVPWLRGARLPPITVMSLAELRRAARLLPEGPPLSLVLEGWENWPDPLDECLAAAIHREGLQRLRRLCLGGYLMSDQQAKVLADCPHLGELRGLELWENQISAPGALALLESEHLQQLRQLDLRGNRLGEDFAHAAANTEALARLESLDLAGNPIKPEGLLALLGSPHLPMCVQEEGLGALGVQVMVDSGKLKLMAEDIQEPQLLERLLALPFEQPPGQIWLVSQGEKSLDLRVRDEHLEALAGSPNMERLQRLVITGSAISDAGLAALHQRETLPNLREIVANFSWGISMPPRPLLNGRGEEVRVAWGS